MLAKRVILCLTFDQGVLMRTKKFVADYRYTQAHCVAGNADELCIIDISRNGPWPGFPELLSTYAWRIDLPCTAGGNVRSWDYAQKLLNSGCDKVLIGYSGRHVYEEVAYKVGSQSLVAGIDISDHATDLRTHTPPELCADVAKEVEARGAGEILLTSVERDGSLGGYDLANLQVATRAVKVPVVVAGGCGAWQHMRQAFEAGAAGAVTSNIFHLNETAMRACKTWLMQNYNGPIREVEVGMTPNASANSASTIAAGG